MPTQEFYDQLKRNVVERCVGGAALRNQGAEGVVGAARAFLHQINLECLRQLSSQQDFNRFLDSQTGKLQSRLPVRARNFGTARKALNLFLRDCLYNKYLSKKLDLDKLEEWLEVPIDSHVAEFLKEHHNGAPAWGKIKSITINESKKFQDVATEVAKNVSIARVHLDLWAWRQTKERCSILICK